MNLSAIRSIALMSAMSEAGIDPKDSPTKTSNPINEAADDDKKKKDAAKKKGDDEEKAPDDHDTAPDETEEGQEEQPEDSPEDAEKKGEENEDGEETEEDGEQPEENPDGDEPSAEGEEETTDSEEGAPDNGEGTDEGEGTDDVGGSDDFSLDGDDPEGGGEDEGPAPDGLPEADDDGSGDVDEEEGEETNLQTNILQLSKLDRALAKKTVGNNYTSLRSTIRAALGVIDRNAAVLDPDVRRGTTDELDNLLTELETFLVYKFPLLNYEDALTQYMVFAKKVNEKIEYVRNNGISKHKS